MENDKKLEIVNDENKSDAYSSIASEENKQFIETKSNNFMEKNGKGFLKELYEWTQAIAVAVVLALIINQFVFSIVEVQGSSMEPTLINNERLFVYKAFYTPKNKDIVIVKSDALGKYIVKRVIATEGQVLDINEETGDVYVDGQLQNEPYIAESLNWAGNINSYPLVIPEGSVFVMGDNRRNSTDSRSLGVINNKDIMGKALFRIWPFENVGGLYKNLK